MKTCSKCGVEKDESEFGKDNRHKDGLTSQCKKCKYEYDKSRSKSAERKETVRKYRNSSEKYKLHKKEYQKTEKYLKQRRERQKKKRDLYLLSEEYKLKKICIIERRIKNRKESIYKYSNSEKCSNKKKEYQKTDKYKENKIIYHFKKVNGFTPPPELVEVKLIINKTKQLCKTLKS